MPVQEVLPGENVKTAVLRGDRITARQHFPVLDGLRAVAVLMVIYFHFWQNFSAKPGLAEIIGKIGQTGVHLFFVLSGFLITGILVDSRKGRNSLRNFYIRRFLRIFPLYYATLLVVFVVPAALHLGAKIPFEKSAWYWVYLQNLPPTFAPQLVAGPNHFWTLAVEEQFYLLWPLLAVSMGKRGILRSVSVGLLIAISLRMLLGHSAAYFTLTEMDGLLMGSALAVLGRYIEGGMETIRGWAKFTAMFVIPILAACGALLAAWEILPKPLVLTFLCLAYTCLVALALTNSVTRPIEIVLCSRALRRSAR